MHNRTARSLELKCDAVIIALTQIDNTPVVAVCNAIIMVVYSVAVSSYPDIHFSITHSRRTARGIDTLLAKIKKNRNTSRTMQQTLAALSTLSSRADTVKQQIDIPSYVGECRTARLRCDHNAKRAPNDLDKTRGVGR